MQTKNKPTWETQQSQEGIIAEAEYEKKEVKHYPMPEYCKCNAGHTLVEVFNEKRNCYDWDCPICIAKMQKARETPFCIECGETEKRVLTQSRGKGVWSCWDCDNRAMQEEDNRAIVCGNHGSCFA